MDLYFKIKQGGGEDCFLVSGHIYRIHKATGNKVSAGSLCKLLLIIHERSGGSVSEFWQPG